MSTFGNFKVFLWPVVFSALHVVTLNKAHAQIPPRDTVVIRTGYEVALPDTNLPNYVPGELLVTIKHGRSLEELRDENAQVGVIETKRMALSEKMEE